MAHTAGSDVLFIVQMFSCVYGVEQGGISFFLNLFVVFCYSALFFCFFVFFFVLGGEGWGGVNFLNISDTMADRICAI